MVTTVLPAWSSCFLMSGIHGCIIESGYSLFHGPLFIPMKAAQCGSDAAQDSFSSSVCNSSRAGYFQFSAPLARTGMKLSNLAALLDFPNVINESNPDDGLDAQKKNYPQLQTSLFPWK